MLKGFLSAVEPDQMETLHRGTLEVLERTGLQIQGEFLLRALADAGCRVDFAARRAWFPPALVERQVTAQRGRYRMVRSSLWYPFCRSLPEDDVALPEEFIVDWRVDTPWRISGRSGGTRGFLIAATSTTRGRPLAATRKCCNKPIKPGANWWPVSQRRPSTLPCAANWTGSSRPLKGSSSPNL